MRNKISEKLEQELISFVTLLGSKVFDGITYLTLKNIRDNKSKIDLCNRVWDSVRADGYVDTVLFRRFYVGDTDLIYDLDLNVCLALGNKLLLQNLNSLGLLGVEGHITKLNNTTKKVRKLELDRLIEYLGDNLNKSTVDIILYNNEKDASVSILGKYNNKDHMLIYNAFRIRHWDLANINDILVNKFGRGLDTLNLCEVIDNIGLRVSITLK